MSGFETGLEGWVMLLRWCRVDVQQYMVSMKPRWFQWGYIMRGEETYGWYILIRLPSYVMMVPLHRDNGPTMHQRCWMFKEKIPIGTAGSWTEIEMECPPLT